MHNAYPEQRSTHVHTHTINNGQTEPGPFSDRPSLKQRYPFALWVRALLVSDARHDDEASSSAVGSGTRLYTDTGLAEIPVTNEFIIIERCPVPDFHTEQLSTA